MSLMPKRGSLIRCPECRAMPGKPCHMYGKPIQTHHRRITREWAVTSNAEAGRVPCTGADLPGCPNFVPEPGGYCNDCKAEYKQDTEAFK